MEIFFSIIIPTFNSEKTISDCIKSILMQEFENFEILVIDGLSADETIAEVKKYSDVRIKIISEKDTGVYDAMNKGIEKASGKYLYFLGGDDSLFGTSVLKNVFDICKSNEYNLVYGNVIFSSKNEVYAGEFSLESLLHFQNISHQAVFYRKDCFESLGKYNLKYKVASDWDFNIRCFMHPNFKIKYVDILIANYNDATGLSKEERDIEFEKISPFYSSQKIGLQLASYKYSKEYRIGRIISSPIKAINNYLKKRF